MEVLEILSKNGRFAGEGESLKEKLTYKNKYKEDFYLLKKDWYESYERLLAFYGLQDIIKSWKYSAAA